MVKQWNVIPPDDERWDSAYILLGIDEFSGASPAVVAIRDATVQLLRGAELTAGDLGEDSDTRGGAAAVTVAKLRWAQRQLERAIAMIEADSFDAFAAARGVPSEGDGGPS